MNRPDLLHSNIPATVNIWSEANEKRNKINELLSKQDRILADREDLRKKISAHLSSLNNNKMF
jgi:hypothetical protein